MGTRIEQATMRKEAIKHLQSALEDEDDDEKDFHIRQALQHLDLQNTTA